MGGKTLLFFADLEEGADRVMSRFCVQYAAWECACCSMIGQVPTTVPARTTSCAPWGVGGSESPETQPGCSKQPTITPVRFSE